MNLFILFPPSCFLHFPFRYFPFLRFPSIYFFFRYFSLSIFFLYVSLSIFFPFDIFHQPRNIDFFVLPEFVLLSHSVPRLISLFPSSRLLQQQTISFKATTYNVECKQISPSTHNQVVLSNATIIDSSFPVHSLFITEYINIIVNK